MINNFWTYLRNEFPNIPELFINALRLMVADQSLSGVGFAIMQSQKYKSLLRMVSNQCWGDLLITEIPPSGYSEGDEITYSKIFKKCFVLKDYSKPIIIPPNAISIKIDEDLRANNMEFAYLPLQLQYLLARPSTYATFNEFQIKQLILYGTLLQIDIPITVDYPCTLPLSSVLKDSSSLQYIQNEKMECLRILNVSNQEDLLLLPQEIQVLSISGEITKDYLKNKKIKCLDIRSIEFEHIPASLETLSISDMPIILEDLYKTHNQLRLVSSSLDKKVYIRHVPDGKWEHYSNS